MLARSLLRLCNKSQFLKSFNKPPKKTIFLVCGCSTTGALTLCKLKPWSLEKSVLNCDKSHQSKIDLATGVLLESEYTLKFDHLITNGTKTGFFYGIYWTFRLIFRAARLWLTFTPIILLYPLLVWTDTTRNWWYRGYLRAVRSGGPCIVKLAQWASTRRDIFSKEFCDHLGKLQRSAACGPWSETVRVLDKTFGRDVWQQLFSWLNREPIGSGCIAQVYQASLRPKVFKEVTGVSVGKDDACIAVAIKVAHPTVLRQLQMDLGILRFAAKLAQYLAPSLKLINPVECVRQFQEVLEKQVDLRNEAQALERFGANFKKPVNGHVKFPVPICYTHDLLVETFETGTHVDHLVKNDIDDQILQSAEVKQKIALTGARALLKMIFVDNFVHGDLHPGNVLIRLKNGNGLVEKNGQNDESLEPSRFLLAIEWLMNCLPGFKSKPQLRFSDSPQHSLDADSTESSADPTLIFLDTGITVEQTPEHLQNLRAVFRAIVQDKGELAGDLILAHSRYHDCSDSAEFRKEMGELVHKAVVSGADLKGLNIGELLSELFSTVRRHRVALEPSFTCVVLAVMVLEGLGRSLDPGLDLFACARPYLLSLVD